MIPSWFTRDLTPGVRDRSVKVVQRKLGLIETGIFDSSTESTVKGFQLTKKMKPTGKVDASTATALGETAAVGMTPIWWRRTLQLWDSGEDVLALNTILGVVEGDIFTPFTEARVRQVQSQLRLPIDGTCHESLAQLLGEL